MNCSLMALLAISVAACSRPTNSATWPTGPPIDLSHDYSDQTVFWPTAEGFKLDKVADGVTEQGYYYAANNFSTSEHGGTHIDAPVHFAKGHRSVDQIPLDQLIGAAIVVDVSAACANQPDYRVTIEDFTGVGTIERRDPGRHDCSHSHRHTRASGPTQHGTSGQPSAVPARSPSCTFPGCTLTPPGGWRSRAG